MCETDFSSGLKERIQCLQELTEFTESCQAELGDLFEALGWNQEVDTLAVQMEVCPNNPNHTVPQDRMEKHKAACLLSQLAYSKEEQAEMCDPSVYYEKANIPTIIMDKDRQQQVILQARANATPMRSTGHYAQSDFSADPPDVPQNHKRALCDLTVADRLALYDHVVQEASHQSTRSEYRNEDLYVDLVAKLKKEEQSGPKSHLEVLAEMRDYRRRRQSYRAKNVHITKKSYTEVIREVIDVHSGELARVWQEEGDEESKASQQSSHRVASEERRSASVESHKSRISSRDEHGRKRHRKRSRSRKRSRDNSREKTKSRRDSHSPDAERHHKKKKKKHKS
ncbi:U11/U12 small nuclear ribonucleoprotein 48 kDa protein isoform X2 [Myxocyprinus asiaticus]|uniref:U11/U12 small nuclear ribonucleoprotein 48 kDa protein isoform X2 n=1 Tax=Myxocyprinus asiaticus TaxID=70543 RepID=UPI002223C0D5|nr:U11/U12 small nuclear ribonucleoprotein 48 kDa protein isoform X2 [Myxocyprinus asiaticus]